MEAEAIKNMAHACDWKLGNSFNPEKMLSFNKKDDNNKRMHLNIHLKSMSVSSIVEHPIHGRTKLFRRNVSRKDLLKIFLDPRVHIGKGFYVESPKFANPKKNFERDVAEIESMNEEYSLKGKFKKFIHKVVDAI